MLFLGAVGGCKGHGPPQDTDKELFRNPQDLTMARELNLAKRIADFWKGNGRLPTDIGELRVVSVVTDPMENPLNDGWGRPISFKLLGRGFELRSNGSDGVPSTRDDLLHRVDDPSAVQ